MWQSGYLSLQGHQDHHIAPFLNINAVCENHTVKVRKIRLVMRTLRACIYMRLQGLISRRRKYLLLGEFVSNSYVYTANETKIKKA